MNELGQRASFRVLRENMAALECQEERGATHTQNSKEILLLQLHRHLGLIISDLIPTFDAFQKLLTVILQAKGRTELAH